MEAPDSGLRTDLIGRWAVVRSRSWTDVLRIQSKPTLIERVTKTRFYFLGTRFGNLGEVVCAAASQDEAQAIIARIESSAALCDQEVRASKERHRARVDKIRADVDQTEGQSQ